MPLPHQTEGLDCDLRPPVLKQAAQLFKDGLSVREVAGTLRVSKTEAGRLRLRAVADGLLVYGHGDDRAGRMVTIRHRVDRLQLAFRPSGAEAYQCVKLDLPPKRYPCPDRHVVAPLGRPPDASPVPLGRRWCGGSAGVLFRTGCSPKTADLLELFFTPRGSGENSRNRADRMPPRGDIGCKLFKI